MISAGKITFIYITSIGYNIIIPLLIVWVVFGKCEGECFQYMIPIYTFSMSLFVYLIYYFLLNEKAENSRRIRLLIYFSPSILMLILLILTISDFKELSIISGIIVIPNILMNIYYYTKLN